MATAHRAGSEGGERRGGKERGRKRLRRFVPVISLQQSAGSQGSCSCRREPLRTLAPPPIRLSVLMELSQLALLKVASGRDGVSLLISKLSETRETGMDSRAQVVKRKCRLGTLPSYYLSPRARGSIALKLLKIRAREIREGTGEVNQSAWYKSKRWQVR